MKAYIALLRIDLLLTLRKPSVFFFNYAVPIASFFAFAELLHADRNPRIAARIVATLLVVGAIANGFFGAGMRAVQEREADILRRFKAAPIGPLPILCASLASGVALYVPAAALVFALAHFIYGAPVPPSVGSLVVLMLLGVLAFRALGLIVASAVRGTQESQIFMQLLYVPMLLLSGATVPAANLPAWAVRVGRLTPSAALYTGFEGIFFRGEGAREVIAPAAALVVTTALGTFLSAKLFRWERDEPLKPAAKLWVALALLPFVVLGAIRAIG